MRLDLQRPNRFYFLIIPLLCLLSACATSKPEPVSNTGRSFTPSNVSADSIAARIPNYSSSLMTAKGKGKAFISEPGNSQRTTLYFKSNRQKSLITAQNGIGIEGGKLLTDGDTLLVYNKIDDYAQIISIKDNNLHRINNLASINLLDILNIPIRAVQIDEVLENETTYLLRLSSGGEAYVNKKDALVRQLDQPASAGLPYSRILYDGYQKINGLILPRKITIFSTDQTAKIDLLMQSLEVNPKLGELTIDLPDDIKIYRQ